MSQVIELSKARGDAARRIQHANFVARFSASVRIAIHNAMRGNKFDVGRVQSALNQLGRAVVVEETRTYKISLSPDDPYIALKMRMIAGQIEGDLMYGNSTVRAEVRRLIPRGTPQAEVARRLKDADGLDARSAKALERYRQKLERSRSQPSKGEIDRSVAKYRRELLMRRANVIATYQTAQAVQQAQEAVMERAIATGQISENTRKVWVVQKDACPNCQAMRGKSVRVSQVFTTPFGAMQHPPMHPHCRCTVRWETR